MGKFAQRRASEATHCPSAKAPVTSVFAQRRAKVQVANLDNGHPKTDNLPDMPASLLSLEQCQVALHIHRARLKGLKTVTEKADYKRTAIADLAPFVQNYISQQHDYPNDVAVWLAIWYFDCAMVEQAVSLALHLIAQKQTLPANFTSSMPVWLCDQIYDYGAEKFQAGQSAEPYFSQVLHAMIECQWPLYEPVGSKMWAMAAKLASLKQDHAQVVTLGEKALAINDKAGVKGLVRNAKAALDKAAQEAVPRDSTPNDPEQGTPEDHLATSPETSPEKGLEEQPKQQPQELSDNRVG